ncbi:Histidine kinase [Pedobacter sp. ok626]|uniref:sensor histidine kinase n=1 Tax=Pedobacter sp. ok626 TaxID=1761882 RepID=UPI00087FC339|nr:histidine kinase [Pedobacter sp. ok626]SDK39304.1 Histidine kinase [Pedobacter sp. ok626]
MGPKSILESKWLQEIFILIFSFLLFTVNDWIFITSWRSFFTGTVYFFILYSHAQINRFFILPILLKEHKPYLYFLLTTTLLFVFSILLFEVSTELLYKNCFLYKSSYQKTYHFQLGTLAGTLICILGSIQILEHYREQKMKTNKELLHNQAQLNVLRAQLNPHFLFNTFNTLYGVSLQYPERSSELIMQVSKLMRYQVENSTKEFIPVEDEIDFISSYVELEKERVGYRSEINYTHHTDNGNYRVAPMLLITFIENAFKHGACSIEKCFVDIDINVVQGTLHMHIRNSIPAKKKKVVSTKIGLKNTIESLKIIYPHKHQLESFANGEEYVVNLKIELAS